MFVCIFVLWTFLNCLVARSSFKNCIRNSGIYVISTLTAIFSSVLWVKEENAFFCKFPQFFLLKVGCIFRFFSRCFMEPIRVPRIQNRVPRIRENYHRVPGIRENQVPGIREIGSLNIHIGYQTFSLKKSGYMHTWFPSMIFSIAHKILLRSMSVSQE